MMSRKVRTDFLAIVLGLVVLVPLASWKYIDRMQDKMIEERSQSLKAVNTAVSQYKDCLNTTVVQSEELEYLRELYTLRKVYSHTLITFLNPNVDPDLAAVIMREVVASSEKYGLHPLLVLSLINRESEFNPMARSRAGALGLMQILPQHHKEKLNGRKPEDLLGIKFNIEVGCNILAGFIRSSNDNLLLALNRYLSMNAPPYLVTTYQRDIVYTTMMLLLEHEESCRQ